MIFWRCRASAESASRDRAREISIEADEQKLRSYGLTFQQIADAVRRNSIDMPAGGRSQSGRLTVRTRGQAYTEEDFSKIPIRSRDGADVLIGEVAKIIDGFEGGTKYVEFNEKPALYVEVMRIGQESAMASLTWVREYVDTAHNRFPTASSCTFGKTSPKAYEGASCRWSLPSFREASSS